MSVWGTLAKRYEAQPGQEPPPRKLLALDGGGGSLPKPRVKARSSGYAISSTTSEERAREPLSPRGWLAGCRPANC
jgi:hypothetical protein